ncbi:hypothetical protein G6F50_017567 [Rhizopus delemar]|uniref:Uncharacterized protein n=1 Tax=Rhizopus delemar TaxID=936053 RepID=A0A9P6XPN7_9FUNG|nr:hypothetical protein G6F50_017567 [Rhizopus delemar]
MDGQDRRPRQRGRAPPGQVQDGGPDGGDSLPAVQPARLRHQHQAAGRRADHCGGGADGLVDAVLPAASLARHPRESAVSSPAVS